MFAVVITEKSGGQRRMEFDKNEVTIGRVQGNDIILPKGNVSKRHSRIVLKDNRFIVVDLKSTNGTYVNGRKITSPLVVKPGDKVYIGDFIMNVEELAAAAAPPPAAEVPFSGGPPPLGPPTGPAPTGAAPSFAQPPAGFGAPSPAPSAPVQSPPPLQSAPPIAPAPAPVPVAPPMAAPPIAPIAPVAPIAPPAPAPAPAVVPMAPAPVSVAPPAPAPVAPAPVAPAPVAAAPAPAPIAPVAPSPVSAPPPPRPSAPPPPPSSSAPTPAPPAIQSNTVPPAPLSVDTNGLTELMAEVATHFDTSEVSARSQIDKGRRANATAVIAKAFGGAGVSRTDDLAQAALQEAVGLGILDTFLADGSIQEILVDGPARVRVDRGEGLETSDLSFSTAAALATVGRRLLAQGGHEPGTLVGVVDLPSGGTASVVLPPIAASGTIIEIRRVGLILTDALVERGVLNTPIANMLTSAVNSGHGVVVVGPANASRDVLALLASAVPESERLVCVDAAQVSVGRSHVALTSGSGVSSSELVRQASRLRADRLLVASVPVGDVFNVVGGAGGMGAAIIGVSAGGGIPTLELGVTLGGVPEGSTHGFLSSAVRIVVVVECVGPDARIVEVSELGAAGVSTLFHWNGSDFAAENAPSF